MTGALSALADDLGFTAGQRSASGSLPAYSAPFGKQNAFASGRILGHGAALVAGFAGVAGGGALVGTGVAATTTGVLAPVGVAAVAGGAVIAAAGAAVVTSATANITAGDPNLQFSTVQQGTGSGNTKHGDQRLSERGFTDEKVDDIIKNYSQKVYQEGGRTVYAKKNGNYYDVIITNANGEVITAVGGNTNSLKTWKDVVKMLNNNGGYSTLPW